MKPMLNNKYKEEYNEGNLSDKSLLAGILKELCELNYRQSIIYSDDKVIVPTIDTTTTDKKKNNKK